MCFFISVGGAALWCYQRSILKGSKLMHMLLPFEWFARKELQCLGLLCIWWCICKWPLNQANRNRAAFFMCCKPAPLPLSLWCAKVFNNKELLPRVKQPPKKALFMGDFCCDKIYFIGFTQIDPGWSEASEEKQRLGTSSAYRHDAWAAMLDWCLLCFCCLVFKKLSCLTGMFSWKRIGSVDVIWVTMTSDFPDSIFKDTCFLNLIEVGGVSLARSMSLRWRGVRLHWDNAFLPLNIVLLGLMWTKNNRISGFPRRWSQVIHQFGNYGNNPTLKLHRFRIVNLPISVLKRGFFNPASCCD